LNFSLTVLTVKRETKDTTTLILKQPLFKKIKYQAGQYINVSVKVNGRKYNRAYSLSSSPSKDETINITVKRLDKGVVSNYLCEIIREGDLLEVAGPYGDFCYDFDVSLKPLFLWAAGSGITPLFSILNEVLIRIRNSRIYLIYSNQDSESVIFKEALTQAQENYPDNLSVIHFYSRMEANISNTEYGGRIGDEFIVNFIKNCSIDLVKSAHFICGPPVFKEKISERLLALGAVSDHVFTEDFALNVNADVLLDVVECHGILDLDGEIFDVFVPRGKSLLDAFLDKVDIPYSCQTGDCRACVAKVLSGQVKSIKHDNNYNMESNQVLLCCTYPISKELKIQL
jgi:ring-1,2-phenylacetyl-CoA epoxidase subunit PaaE